MLNQIVLMGRLTRDPELRRTGSGVAVASFTLAVDRDFAAQGAEKETDFVDIVAWRNTAEFVSRFFLISLNIKGAYHYGYQRKNTFFQTNAWYDTKVSRYSNRFSRKEC